MNRAGKAEGRQMPGSNETKIQRGDIDGREQQSEEKKWHRYLKWENEYYGSGLQFSSERYRELSNFARSWYRVSHTMLA
jgi:hypothetical protein